MLDHQVDRYARTEGIDLEKITAEQRDSVRNEMIKKHYPGKNSQRKL